MTLVCLNWRENYLRSLHESGVTSVQFPEGRGSNWDANLPGVNFPDGGFIEEGFGENVRLSRRQDGLRRPVDTVKQVGAAGGVQLRDELIQQQDRPFSGDTAHPIQLGQFDRHDGSTGLPARTILAKIVAIDDEMHVV